MDEELMFGNMKIMLKAYFNHLFHNVIVNKIIFSFNFQIMQTITLGSDFEQLQWVSANDKLYNDLN